jgi:hypothetical protein
LIKTGNYTIAVHKICDYNTILRAFFALPIRRAAVSLPGGLPAAYIRNRLRSEGSQAAFPRAFAPDSRQGG